MRMLDTREERVEQRLAKKGKEDLINEKMITRGGSMKKRIFRVQAERSTRKCILWTKAI